MSTILRIDAGTRPIDSVKSPHAIWRKVMKFDDPNLPHVHALLVKNATLAEVAQIPGSDLFHGWSTILSITDLDLLTPGIGMAELSDSNKLMKAASEQLFYWATKLKQNGFELNPS